MTPSIKEALEPCPFCHSTRLESGGDDKFVGVRCLDCEATGPNHYITGRDWNIRSSVETAPHAKDALEHARMFIENGVELGYIKMPDVYTPDPAHETLGKIKAVLATLQPSGERREAIARIICYWDEPSTCHDNYCVFSCRAKTPDARFFKAADAILASGLVQDEAGIRADEREKCAKVIDMQFQWDDREEIAAAIRSARNET